MPSAFCNSLTHIPSDDSLCQQARAVLLNCFQIQAKKRECPVPESAVQVRVVLGRPVGPVSLVHGNAVQPLDDWNVNHIGPVDLHGLAEQVGDLRVARGD